MRTYLGLITGEVFPGISICFGEETTGELIIYNSRKFRYQILTDPACYGKIIVADSAVVDNRWPLDTEIESFSTHLKALVILGDFRHSAIQNEYYNLRNYLDTNMITLFKPDQPGKLEEVLKKHSPVSGILTKNSHKAEKINIQNTLNSADFPASLDLARCPGDSAPTVSTSQEFIWDMSGQRIYNGRSIEKKYLVVAYDFGLPYSTLRNLSGFGCDIRIVPADCSPEDLIALRPEGILLAGGPGSPESMPDAVSNIARLIGLRPILATGLGHILLALSMGAKLEILKKPHFGDEIGVRQVAKMPRDFPELHKKRSARRRKIFKTVQTHLVCPDRNSLERAGFKVSLLNAEDNSVEAYENQEFLIQSYAFSLGGDDDLTLACLRRFVDCMEEHRTGRRLF